MAEKVTYGHYIVSLIQFIVSLKELNTFLHSLSMIIHVKQTGDLKNINVAQISLNDVASSYNTDR